MKLSQIKKYLPYLKTLTFQLPDGSFVPSHFHITEVGKISKHFIDCGGTVRNEDRINFQLWEANDYNHRLHPEKLIHIIELSEKVLDLEDLDIEVEYQGDTLGKFGLDFDGTHFLLTLKKTDCLAKGTCNVPDGKQKVRLSDLQKKTSQCCTSDSECC